MMGVRLFVATGLLAAIQVALGQGMTLSNQESALYMLKASLDGNEAFSTWGPQNDVCSEWKGVQCNSEGVVTGLQLGNMQLSGQLPFGDSVWGSLPELETIDLSNNNIGGYLPPNIGTLKKLNSLKLGDNSFNGQLPPSWGDLSELQILELQNNELGGPLPPQWSKLSKLERLDLSGEARGGFTGGIPTEWRQAQGGKVTGMKSLKNLNVQVQSANCGSPGFEAPEGFTCGAPGQPPLQFTPRPTPPSKAPTAKQTIKPTAATTKSPSRPTSGPTARPTRDGGIGILKPPPPKKPAAQPALQPSAAEVPGLGVTPASEPALEPAPKPALKPVPKPALEPAPEEAPGPGPAAEPVPAPSPEVAPSPEAVGKVGGVPAPKPSQGTAATDTALQTTMKFTGLTPAEFDDAKKRAYGIILSQFAKTPIDSTTVQSAVATAKRRRLLLFRRHMLQAGNVLSVTSTTRTGDTAAAERNIRAGIASGELPKALKQLGLTFVPGSLTSTNTVIPALPPGDGKSNSKRLAKIIVPSVVGGLIILALLSYFCVIYYPKNKKRKERSTISKVQPGKEYPVADPAGYGGSPKHGDNDGAAAKDPEAVPFKSTDTQPVDNRVVDRGDHHEILKDHPVVREGDFHVYPEAAKESVLVSPPVPLATSREPGSKIAAPPAVGTVAAAAVGAVHKARRSGSFESQRSSFESAQSTEHSSQPGGSGFDVPTYASSFATAKPAQVLARDSRGPSGGGRSFATANPYGKSVASQGYDDSFATARPVPRFMEPTVSSSRHADSFATAVPAPITPPPPAATTNQPDSFATAKQAAGSAIPGAAYAESFATAGPAKASPHEGTGYADSFATAQPASKSVAPTAGGAPSFATAAPYGIVLPKSEYAETFATAAPATAAQTGRLAATEYADTYATAKPATAQQVGGLDQTRSSADSFATAAQPAPPTALGTPDSFATAAAPQSMSPKGPMVAAAVGAVATIGAAASFVTAHQDDKVDTARQGEYGSFATVKPYGTKDHEPKDSYVAVAPARKVHSPFSPGADTFASTSQPASSSGNDQTQGSGASFATLAPSGSPSDRAGRSYEPSLSSVHTRSSTLTSATTSSGLEGAANISKGGAAPRATATRGIVGKSGKMKYFSTGKSAPSSSVATPTSSEKASAVAAGRAAGRAVNPIVAAPTVSPLASQGSFDSAQGAPAPGSSDPALKGPGSSGTVAGPASSARFSQASSVVPQREPAVTSEVTTPRILPSITPRTGHVAERASIFGGQSPGGDGTSTAKPTTEVSPPSGVPTSTAADLERFSSAQSNITFHSATSQALQSEPSLPRSGSLLGPGAAAALASPAPPDTSRWSGFDTARSGWETSRSRADSSMPASARGGMASARGIPSSSTTTGEVAGFDTARSGIGGTPRSAFSGTTPRQYSYRSTASGDGSTGETPRDRIGLGGDLSAHAMPGDTGVALTPRPVQFTDSDSNSEG